MTLIQRLAQMSMEKYGDDLKDVDPSTGAKIVNRIPDNDAAVGIDTPSLTISDDVDEESEMITMDKASMLRGGGENVANNQSRKGICHLDYYSPAKGDFFGCILESACLLPCVCVFVHLYKKYY